MDKNNILKILEKHNKGQGGLIPILQDIQTEYGYLEEDALRIVSEESGRSLVDIYGVATFYKHFSLKPRGKHLVSVCLGTACHVRNAPSIAEELQKHLGISSGETTPDKEFTLETVNCLGACALGPIVVIDGHYFSNVTTSKVPQILAQAKEGLDKTDVQGDSRIFPVRVSCPRCNHSLMDSEHLIDNHPSIKTSVSFGNKHCSLRLSSLYGSYSIESKYKIPDKTVLNLFCPHCHAELIAATTCTECDAPLIAFVVEGGAMIHICSRQGCKTHRLDLNGVNF